MSKCGACGKFLSRSSGVTCTKCTAVFHHLCVGISNEVQISATWICPDCKALLPREDNANTPVKGLSQSLKVGDSINTVGQKSNLANNDDLRTEFKLLLEELRAARQEISMLRFDLNNRLSVLEGRIDALETGRQERNDVKLLETSIAQLKLDLNDRDQRLLSNDIEITGLPETPGESVVHIAMTLAVKLGVPLDERDIVSAVRVGARRGEALVEGKALRPRPRPIAVRLARRSTRDDVLRSARVRRGTVNAAGLTPATPVTLADVTAEGPSCTLYVNERLTAYNRHLFYKARESGRRHAWKYIWTRDGRIYARQSQASPVSENDDMSKFFDSNGGRIVGGEEAPQGEYKNMVALSTGALVTSFVCGGSLVTSRHVLTAAHCIDAVYSRNSLQSSLRLTVGTNQWNRGGTEYRAQSNVTHPNWVSQIIKNDIGFLITDVVVAPNNLVATIPVNFDYIDGGVEARVAGWGRTRQGGSLSANLLHLRVTTLGGEECVRLVRQAEIDQNMRSPGVQSHIELCTYHSPSHGTCNGDSGSALIRQDTRVQIGIVSWGFPCARGAPDMFVRVSAFKEWFSSVTSI